MRVLRRTFDAKETDDFLCVSLHGASTFLKGGWSTGKFVSSYISLPLFVVFLIMGRILARRGMVRSVHMDFESSVMRLREMEVPDNGESSSFQMTG